MKVLAILIPAALILSAAKLNGPVQTDLVAHEWGTFTSIAGEDGRAVAWAPLFGAPDLPCFVSRLGNGNRPKWELEGLVRMETPVLYFYSQHPATLDVHVGFPRGVISEWYPQASKVMSGPANLGGVYRGGGIEWNGVQVQPGANETFPTTKGASRYYAARETDAAPLQIGEQHEKLIFYRGVGNFAPPVRPVYREDGKLEIRNTGEEPIPFGVLFENHRGKIAYRTLGEVRDSVSVSASTPANDLNHLRAELTGALTQSGLYAKEAAAMMATWDDSWFEEGSRIIYILPRQQVDALVPLTVSPSPAQINRVFVGRVEVLSPATREAMEQAAASGDSTMLAKYGRFLGWFSSRLRIRNAAAVQNAFTELNRVSSQTCIP